MQIFKLFIDRKWSGDFPTLEFAQAEGEAAAKAGQLVHIEPDEVPAFQVVPTEGWWYDPACQSWVTAASRVASDARQAAL